MQGIGKLRVEKRLDQFVPFVDMADWDRRPVEQKRAAFLSRALAAYCIRTLAETTDEVAARSITDSFHDRGLDAIHYDEKSSRLLVVQSKWSDQLDWKSAGELCDGCRKLVGLKWELFSNVGKIYSRQIELTDIITSGNAKIVFVTVCAEVGNADSAARRRVDQCAAELDMGVGIFSTCHWKMKHLLEAMESESKPPTINVSLALSQYGEVKEPYNAVYGRVQARTIVELWKQYPHLSHSNIRRYFTRSDVNSAMAETAMEAPADFWYFNNGLTVICDSIRPAIYGRDSREEGIFYIDGMSIVNGAQTTGILADYLDKIPEPERNKIWIQIRIIATKNCPDGFGASITKFTNLQNAVTAQDFVGLDPIHARLAADFAIQHRRYAFKSGEKDPDDGCNLRDLTVALACADPDSWFAVQAKREISVLWQTEGSRYRRLFHRNLTATRAWNAVCIMRAVEVCIKRIAARSQHEKAQTVAAHLQRIILYCVFRSARLEGWDKAPDPAAVADTAGEVCDEVFQTVCEYVKDRHGGDYLASLSKNFEKSKSMVDAVTGPGRRNWQPELPWPEPLPE